MPKQKMDNHPNYIDLGRGIKFCLNCDDMDDLATDDDQSNKNVVKKRFQNCQKNGRFDGDVCSRMYVIGEDDFEDNQFIDPVDED